MAIHTHLYFMALLAFFNMISVSKKIAFAQQIVHVHQKIKFQRVGHFQEGLV